MCRRKDCAGVPNVALAKYSVSRLSSVCWTVPARRRSWSCAMGSATCLRWMSRPTTLGFCCCQLAVEARCGRRVAGQAPGREDCSLRNVPGAAKTTYIARRQRQRSRRRHQLCGSECRVLHCGECVWQAGQRAVNLGICVASSGSHNLRRSESQPDLGGPGYVCQAAGCGWRRYEERWREGKNTAIEAKSSTQAGRQSRVDEGFLGADCESLICAGAFTVPQ
jgi:hypothetical protein